MKHTISTVHHLAALAAATSLACVSAVAAGNASTSHGQDGALVETVRDATAQFLSSSWAVEADYIDLRTCVAGPNEGAMGVHFVKLSLLGDGMLDATQPEALIYEFRGNRMRLLGAEFIALADPWHAANGAAVVPTLMGQQFHYVGAPNRYGLPALYELHVWAWKNNPKGMFTDWNPRVSCAQYTPPAA